MNILILMPTKFICLLFTYCVILYVFRPQLVSYSNLWSISVFQSGSHQKHAAEKPRTPAKCISCSLICILYRRSINISIELFPMLRYLNNSFKQDSSSVLFSPPLSSGWYKYCTAINYHCHKPSVRGSPD